MSRRMTDEYIDDLPELNTEDTDAEAAFWDEFIYLEQKDEFDRSYTVIIEDELTGEKKTFKNVKLGNMKTNKNKMAN